jgi:alginate O-acetyltransferase complex protein AlgI
LFKKVYIGNNLGLLIDNSLNRQLDLLNLVFVSILTTFKIYADFSGYSDVARGIGKLFNIELTINFLPFFNSKNPSQFWSTWHLSLTSWVKEYLFASLIGKNPTPQRFYICLFLSFIIIGVWHGPTANWFVFGLFHGTVVIVYRLIKRNAFFVQIPDFFGYLFMFFFYAVCGILHNNTDLQKINFSVIFHKSLDTDYFLRNFMLSILLLGPLVFFDKLQMKHKKEFFLYDQQLLIRYGVYLFWFFSILIFNHSNQGFVYYQF